MPGEIDVSYILPVYNKRSSLEATLKSLQAQQGDLSFEFVFVDDGSTDGSLEYLQTKAESDPRIRVAGGDGNVGPSIRLNQGAQAARGDWLMPMDADDLSPPNAAQWMKAELHDASCDLLYGKRRKGNVAQPIPETANIEIADAALAFAATRRIVHMALMVKRETYLKAGGADEAIFIQDQSLPLRLAHAAGRMIWTSETVCWAPDTGDTRLSANTDQQHHDRFFSMRNMIRTLPADHDALPALRQQAISALWKLRRDAGGAAILSPAFLHYVLNKWALFSPDLDALDRLGRVFSTLENVRRPDNTPHV